MNIYPIVGQLYKFRTENQEYILNKYSYYYVGLVLCVQNDVVKDMNFSSSFNEAVKHNPIFGFETYNCIQHFNDATVFKRGLKAPEIIFLTYREVNDMLELARSA